ncbi:wall-associated receptor kinase 5-like [Pyrus ussuriensis x Pyrus communis]|uniref:Wall-associated receptor kinase 5-like n=1 Tax=Pyrus ussuriensis x Pyrus communis TaxID=2448454 RepID=A0A5N5H000_9ROSA|nr:wall-associated receptor kinase 5-like [Pyrus ussuriensis x Pyrus communis]KAB2620662.1 wall-associated receptor kinase 5-like [Pyrus ussuriensis x Pyrus communis]KAB2620667.1 wall-associated receptor kinase 5-like [Pyrus ussuriensis x Pyrus communis]
MVNQGGSWVSFVEGNESFKMVVVASKNSTGVGRNRPWKMDPRADCGPSTGTASEHGSMQIRMLIPYDDGR